MAKNKKKKQHRFWWFVVKLQVFCLCVVATALGVFYFGGYVKDFNARQAYHSFGDAEDQFKRFDAGLKIGCGFSIQAFYAELNFNVGLANIGHDMFDETHNRGVSLTVGVNF